MRKLCALFLVAVAAGTLSAAETPQAFVSGMTNPESVCYGPDGLLYVSEIGDPAKDGDGKVSVIKDGKPVTFCDGLDNPKGIVFWRDALYVTDVTKIWQISASGEKKVWVKAEDFPAKPVFLNDLAVDKGGGIFLVSDSGDRKGQLGAVYRIDHRLHEVEAVLNQKIFPALNFPNGVEFDGGQFAIVADMGAGLLYRLDLQNKKAEQIAAGLDGADGLVWDPWGRLFITSWRTGKVFGIARPGEKPVLIGEGLKAAADLTIDKDNHSLLIPDMKSGTLTRIATTIPGWEVDTTPLTVKTEIAFPNLKWTGWDNGEETGKVDPFRAILLTHAGDGSGRIFVPQQQGIIHSFKADDKETKIFLDISKKVRYLDKQNEEGLLGLAFHPKFKENGEFFVFYTDVNATMANVVSRFKVKKDDPSVADPASEEEIIRFEKPFWNHDGGTILFGKDGYLYITHGDGGNGGDPKENGQNKGTLLGKVLRLDIDKPGVDGKKYAIPADNPFVKTDGAAPEVWCYGLRNVWRMSFDRETGDLWAGEVGQGLFEEINIFTKGNNYGWNPREGLHPFGRKGVGDNKEMVDPLWEYHHSLGVSITGGNVYRGKEIPALQGHYLYADYVSSKCWALKYDKQLGRVVANRPIDNQCNSPMSFGEDEAGETYIMGPSPRGQGIYKFVK